MFCKKKFSLQQIQEPSTPQRVEFPPFGLCLDHYTWCTYPMTTLSIFGAVDEVTDPAREENVTAGTSQSDRSLLALSGWLAGLL